MKKRTRKLPPVAHPSRRARQRRPRILATSAAALLTCVFFGAASHALAANATWNATPTDANWVTTTENNWSTGAGTFPGVIADFASGAGSQFTVFGPDTGRDSLLVGAGFAVIWSDRFSSYVYYDGEIGRTNYQGNSVTGGLRMTF